MVSGPVASGACVIISGIDVRPRFDQLLTHNLRVRQDTVDEGRAADAIARIAQGLPWTWRREIGLLS